MTDQLGEMRRTHHCSALRKSDLETRVMLMGWVQRRRDHGGVIFVDLRDREGLTQVVFNPVHNPAVHEKAHAIRNEYVIAVEGRVYSRPEGMANPNLPTGEIEVMVDELKILNRAVTPPFMIDDDNGASETIRLQNRHIDLRRPNLQRNIIMRHRAGEAIRAYLNDLGFLDIETPFLTRSTPEGARDYLVPSRTNPGNFYALPQSPQLFKQLLMVSGFDRYYQVVRCFRDEDLRADRQPEFTQIDLEMSFVGESDVMEVAEGLVSAAFQSAGVEGLNTPFDRMTYAEAVGRFGLDRPDIRFGLELCDISDIVANAGFKLFADVVKKGGVVKAINAKGCAGFTRKEIDDFTAFVAVYKARGLAYIKVRESEWQSPIAKFFTEAEKSAMTERLDMQPGDMVFFGADEAPIVNESLGYLRNHLGRKLGLIDDTVYRFVWVTDFPLVEYDSNEKRYQALHHPFTAPMEKDCNKLETDPLSVLSRAYDLVLNGAEIGGGSIRIHDRDLQVRVLKTLGMEKDEYEDKFGFLLNALESGAPPHGGIAFGFDRLMAILCGSSSIREVIPFPKTQKGSCLLTSAPSRAGNEQLQELGLRVTVVE
ncbi:aspartate--tRNA ligase [Natronospira sp.]|uniref:aspartate--tRNA ligase n=1 Tax=Natronospira sp. TaxID=2024970 RepID=UPI003872FCCE